MDMGTLIDSHDPSPSSSSPLIADLIKHAPLYDFIAAIRLLRAWLNQQHLPIVWPQLKFSAHLSLAFVNSDIQKVECDERQQFNIIANFLAIYGTSSPLPNYYTEEILDNMNQDNPITRDFLNLFQQRLYESYFEYYNSIELNGITDSSRNYLQKLYAVAGLGNADIHANLPPEKLLCYAGLLSSKNRTYQGLAHLLGDYCGATVEIDAYHLMTHTIPPEQHVYLGQKNCRLGEDSHIGQSYVSARNNLNIRFSQLSRDTFMQLLPGKPLALEVKELIRMYVLQSLHVRLELHGQFESVCDDSLAPILGEEAWLGTANRNRIVAYLIV